MTIPRVLLAAFAVLLAAGSVLLMTALRNEPELPGIAREPAPSVEGLVFLDHADPDAPREVTLIPEPGGLVLAYFGYLSCPDVCPMTMVDIARAQDQIGQELAQRTTVAFVTLDPARDDGERLKSYLEHFFDGSYLALMAPDELKLHEAADRIGVRWEIEPHEPGDERYDVAHTAITYVIDDTGSVVRELPFGATPEEYAQVMRALLS